MKHIQDPFPPTPQGFHLRVERTLDTLEEDRKMKQCFSRNKTLILIAAIIAAMATVTAMASLLGNARLKGWLNRQKLGEVAEQIREVHLGDAGDDFEFSIDELIWEDDDLYISYSLSVPGDGRYMVALYTPTLNGEKLAYDAKGFAFPRFFDSSGDFPHATLLLLGGSNPTDCNDLLTFAVDPRLKQRRDNRLRFKAVLLRTDLNLEGDGDWTGLLNPPRTMYFSKGWRDEISPEALQALDQDDIALKGAVTAAFGDDDTLTLEELLSTGCVEYVAERKIDMGLDGTKLDADVLYNDVAEHDFGRLSLRVHIDRFRMSHLGIEIEYTVSAPGMKDGATAIQRLDSFDALQWRFSDADGNPLGYDLGGTGGSGSIDVLADGTPARHHTWHEDIFLPLDGLGKIAFAPCTFVDNANDNGNHPVYDLENAIMLTPVFSEAIAEADARAIPKPMPDENEADISQ